MTSLSRLAVLAAAVPPLLAVAACATTAAEESAVNPPHPGVVLVGSLLPAGEVPGPGDPDGSGEFTGFFDQPGGKLCFDLGVGSLDRITMQHIHAGAAQVAGPPVITLPVPDGTHSEGCIDVDRALLARIIAKPGDFYVNVHTSTHPNGAIRSQLMRP
jgi:hypothetical protein